MMFVEGFASFVPSVLFLLLCYVWYRRCAAINAKYLRGVPTRYKFYMIMLIAAFRGLEKMGVRGQGADWKNIDGRWYFSINVLHFRAPVQQDDPERFNDTDWQVNAGS